MLPDRQTQILPASASARITTSLSGQCCPTDKPKSYPTVAHGQSKVHNAQFGEDRGDAVGLAGRAAAKQVSPGSRNKHTAAFHTAAMTRGAAARACAILVNGASLLGHSGLRGVSDIARELGRPGRPGGRYYVSFVEAPAGTKKDVQPMASQVCVRCAWQSGKPTGPWQSY
jgi:hypothetical protein